MTVYYEDEHVTLHLGDCLEERDWLTADVLVTDPPYGVDWIAGGMRANLRDRVRTRGQTRRIAGDHDTALRDEILERWGDKPAVIFGSWRAPRPAGTRARLLWHKATKNPGLGSRDLPWYPVDEEIYILGAGFSAARPAPGVITTRERRDGNQGQAALIGHPTPKPLPLMEHLILRCPPGLIADPCAGSGATLLAAKALGRKAVGVEIDERYCEITARRLSQGVLDLTGGAA